MIEGSSDTSEPGSTSLKGALVLRQPATVLFSGYSGAGKTTIARAVAAELLSAGADSVVIDGDDLRNLSKSLGFTREDRAANLQRAAELAIEANSRGLIALCALIAPFHDARSEFVAALANEGYEALVVHVSTPISECKRRDTKGLYAKAFRGELLNLTGVDSPFEVPHNPSAIIETTTTPIEKSVGQVIQILMESNRLAGAFQ